MDREVFKGANVRRMDPNQEMNIKRGKNVCKKVLLLILLKESESLVCHLMGKRKIECNKTGMCWKCELKYGF